MNVPSVSFGFYSSIHVHVSNWPSGTFMYVCFLFFYCIMFKNYFTSHFLELFVIHKDFRVKSYLFTKIKKNQKISPLNRPL